MVKFGLQVAWWGSGTLGVSDIGTPAVVRTAFLILAHHHPTQVARLVGRLQSPGARVFIHLDRKSDMAPFHAMVGDRATFVPRAKRVSVIWGAYSMVEAVLNLIEAAIEAEPDLERFVLLSGADYPTRPVDQILAALEPGREYIRVDRALDPKGNGEFDRRANRVFLGSIAWLNPRNGSWRLSQIAEAVERFLPRLGSYGQTIHYGPQWWALTREAVELVLASRRRLGWFRRARTPDEMVFQTVLKHSHLADAIVQDATRGPADWHPYLAGITYVDFEHPNPQAPRTLGLEDLPSIQASGALFVRKIDPERSAELVRNLDVSARKVVRRPRRAA